MSTQLTATVFTDDEIAAMDRPTAQSNHDTAVQDIQTLTGQQAALANQVIKLATGPTFVANPAEGKNQPNW